MWPATPRRGKWGLAGEARIRTRKIYTQHRWPWQELLPMASWCQLCGLIHPPSPSPPHHSSYKQSIEGRYQFQLQEVNLSTVELSDCLIIPMITMMLFAIESVLTIPCIQWSMLVVKEQVLCFWRNSTEWHIGHPVRKYITFMCHYKAVRMWG